MSMQRVGDAGTDREPRKVTWLFLGSIPVGLGLAAFGYYVLAYIAPGRCEATPQSPFAITR